MVAVASPMGVAGARAMTSRRRADVFFSSPECRRSCIGKFACICASGVGYVGDDTVLDVLVNARRGPDGVLASTAAEVVTLAMALSWMCCSTCWGCLSRTTIADSVRGSYHHMAKGPEVWQQLAMKAARPEGEPALQV